jgi:hypothetical protein
MLARKSLQKEQEAATRIAAGGRGMLARKSVAERRKAGSEVAAGDDE